MYYIPLRSPLGACTFLKRPSPSAIPGVFSFVCCCTHCHSCSRLFFFFCFLFFFLYFLWSGDKAYKKLSQSSSSSGPSAQPVKLLGSEGEVFLHPTSVLYGESHFSSPLLVYHEKVQTSKVYIRDASPVTCTLLSSFYSNDL